MAKTQKNKRISKIKVKKKIWYKLIAPSIFGNKEIGESYLTSAEKAIGRRLKVNLKDLTGNIKDQNVHINFQITKINGSNLSTSVIGYQLSPTYIKRIVKKRTGRVDDNVKLETKGKKKVILKTLIITLNKAQRSTKTQLRKELSLLLKEELSKMTFENFISNLVNFRIQSGIKRKLNKIYPVKEFAVRALKLNEKLSEEKEQVVENKLTTEKVQETQVEKTQEEFKETEMKEKEN